MSSPPVLPKPPVPSRWTTTTLKYTLLVTPLVVMLGLFGLIGAGAWIAAVLRGSMSYADAPIVIQKYAQGVYYSTRNNWLTLPGCAMFDRELLYKPRPGTCEFRNVEFNTTLHFDERGYRKSASPRAAPDATARPRLVMLGDSHTMGWGVEDDETFASLLASEFGYPTVNLGVSSYGTARELRRLEHYVELRPDDVIVLQYSDNDLPENRHFLATGHVGPYEPSEFEESVQSHRATPATTWPVSARLVTLIWRDVMNQVPQQARVSASAAGEEQVGGDPASVLLSIVKSSPTLQQHRFIVLVINANLESHLLAGRDQFANAGIPLVVPPLTPDMLFSLDDHMRPTGHRLVTSTIAAGTWNRERLRLCVSRGCGGGGRYVNSRLKKKNSLLRPPGLPMGPPIE